MEVSQGCVEWKFHPSILGFNQFKEARPEEKDKDKEKEMVPGERTPKDRTWTVVKERHREDSGHGKMCGEWVIVDRCEVLIAYCATCELMID
ncbi:hypothetical protein Bca52824_059236 [Brassica carinata]|uniref:Uncharacterized protein n=1 Tax=Brassica carinata TaxID=52824 RepID=A0A8X7UI14_BRACI|nr:hypothetical protein Bca52824_059236 [Brassica carinata]